MTDFSTIPEYLKIRAQWILWGYRIRNNRQTKVPFQTNGRKAASNRRTTWNEYTRCLKTLLDKPTEYNGLGFCFAEGDNLVGIDLDDCLDGNVLTPWASEIVYRFTDCEQSWTEITPSGTGLHIWCHGYAQRSGKGAINQQIEVYDYRSPRYFTVTGAPFLQGGLHCLQEDLDWLHEKHMKHVEIVRSSVTSARSLPERSDNEKVAWALDRISADIHHDDWIKVGMCLKEAGEPFSTWEAWSRTGSKYTPGECEQRWKSFGRRRGVELGTLMWMAKQAGHAKKSA